MAGFLRGRAAWLDTWLPVIVVVLLGGTWIAVHASAGRGQVHTVFQVLALAESAVALLLRRRKPVGALAGILVVYLLVDLDTILILPLLLALLTVAEMRGARTTAVACLLTAVTVVAMPLLHGDRAQPGPLKVGQLRDRLAEPARVPQHHPHAHRRAFPLPSGATERCRASVLPIKGARPLLERDMG